MANKKQAPEASNPTDDSTEGTRKHRPTREIFAERVNKVAAAISVGSQSLCGTIERGHGTVTVEDIDRAADFIREQFAEMHAAYVRAVESPQEAKKSLGFSL